jgi:biofilm protein TabA
MRKIAKVDMPDGPVRRLMIYQCEEGVYLFAYLTDEDGCCDTDELYATVEEAENAVRHRYRVAPESWQRIDDPSPGAQHDWIRPTRIKRDGAGGPIWGAFEPMPRSDM